MTRSGRHPVWSWIIHTPWVLAVLALLAVIAFFGSGAGNPIITRAILRRIQQSTGGRAELQGISIHWLSLRVSLKGLVIHGSEPSGTPPFFAAGEINAGLRIDSFWGRKISLDSLAIEKPRLHIRVASNGSNNVPVPARRASSKPLAQTIFALHARQVALNNGWILYNDVAAPLALEGDDLQIAINASGPLDHPLYLGRLEWRDLRFTARRYLPVPINISAKFTASRDGFSLDQGVLGFLRSHFDIQAVMTDFSHPAWTYKYRGWLDLLDCREIFREPVVPAGRVDLHGEGAFGGGAGMLGTGSFSGRDIALRLIDFHYGGMSSRGTYRLNRSGLEIPDFSAYAFQGSVKGKVTLQFQGVKFRAVTHTQDIRLAQTLPALEHRNFPIDELHWDGILTADTVATWTRSFREFEVGGAAAIVPPATLAPGHQPVTGNWTFHYRHVPSLLSVQSSTFETPNSRVSASGILSPGNTSMDLKFEAASLATYHDFINALRDLPPSSPGAKKPLAGSARWDGRVTGSTAHPTFTGHLRGEQLRYGGLSLDTLEGDLVFSPSFLQLANTRARRAEMSAELDGSIGLTRWQFLPDNAWSADINLDQASLQGLEQLAGFSYPVRGRLTGQFHGRGTRAEPALTGLFDLSDADIYGLSFNRLRGRLEASPQEARIADAELRFFPPGKEAARGAGIITGSAAYRFAGQTLSADIVGAGLPLENFERLQTSRLPVGGQLNLRLKLEGSIRAPLGDGTFRVVDLRVGNEVIGSFNGSLVSDGRSAHLQLGSAMTAGEISGSGDIALVSPFPVSGKIDIRNINLEPFLITALHAQKPIGHAVADGEISLSGSLQNPDSLLADARFSRLLMSFGAGSETISLQNTGPVHLRSSRQKLEIEPASFQGPDSNFAISGSAQFNGSRALALKLNGAVDLRLLNTFLPGAEDQTAATRPFSIAGLAQIDAAVEGSLDRPRITGKVRIASASARAADFPTGLSNVTGDLIFDANRLSFSNLTAEAGGGTLAITGSVSYAERPLRYDISAKTDQVRIRYPEGMSWLVGGSLHLTGTPQAALLAGRVQVRRVTLAQGLEVAGMLVAAKEGLTAPSASSAFLRNLQFDIEGVSTPDTRVEWPSAELEAEAQLRVRGTWEHPILLGHIHILSGNLQFAGNRYSVSRGDLNFANPFRIDPVLSVEAVTTIQQYEITLNFSGPASKLTLAYRSDPPLPASDIVTLLALGQTSSESAVRTSGASGAQNTAGATALLSEAISSQVGGRLERLFGITRFRVDPGLVGLGATATNQNAGARVTVEQQITRNLTITYESNVSSTQEQVIQVEYNVNRNVSIVALRDQNGTFGIDVKIRKRFD
jgi:translocation and assembly module TamB